MKRRAALIEVGAGNLFNVECALQRLGLEVARVRRPEELLDYDTIVFPGVAHFAFVVDAMAANGLDEALRAAIASGAPFLGICVGMQVLYESSEEAPGKAGLGILRGKVTRLRGPKLPQIGWNEVSWNAPPAGPPGWAYFANSYAAEQEAEGVAAICEYGRPFAAACIRDNVIGLQFHPERSGRYGAGILKCVFARETAVLRAR
jgi:imidazole glycerol phosphate synthase glutamine amidotransferase subunit